MADIDCAVVLAGGKGTRLRPLTTDKPKPLVPVCLTPMIDFAIDALVKAKIKKVIVAVKYLGEQIRQYLKEKEEYFDLEIIIPDIDPIGTADAVRKVSDLINGDFVVSMADIVCNLDLNKMIDFYSSTQAYSTISLKNISFPTKKFGVIMLDQQQNIEIFLEKPLPQDLLFTTLAYAHRPVAEFHQNLVNTGIYIFNHKILDIFDSFSDIIDFGKDVFPYLLHEKFKLNGFVSDYYWMDCGTPKNYLWANWDLLRGFVDGVTPPGNNYDGKWIGKGVSVSPKAKIIPPVVIGNNVIIEEQTEIGPFTVIGGNSILEKGVKIDHGVLWENVKVQEESFIHKSTLCDNVIIEPKMNVTDYSVVGKGVKIDSNIKTTKKS